MTGRTAARHAYPIGVSLLLAAILLVGGFVAIVALPELLSVANRPGPAEPTSTPNPTSQMGGAIGIAIPPDTDCGACHLDPNGLVGTRDIPRLAHPLEGWRDCTACHANDRLVKTAPGHSSLHKADCLTCHKVPASDESAPPRPHHLVTGKACLECHGVTEAPLPTDMAGRNNCWLCHSGTEFEDLFRRPGATLPPPTIRP